MDSSSTSPLTRIVHRFGVTDEYRNNIKSSARRPNHAENFSRWHREIPDGSRLLAADADWFEYRLAPDGRPVLVAYFELTCIAQADRFRSAEHQRRYLANISNRYRHTTKGHIAVQIAESLGIPLYIVAFLEDCTRFYLCDFLNCWYTGEADWQEYTSGEMAEWIRSLESVNPPHQSGDRL